MKKWKQCLYGLLYLAVCTVLLKLLTRFDSRSLSSVLQGFVPLSDFERAGVRVNLLTSARWLCVWILPVWYGGYIIDQHMNRKHTELVRYGKYTQWWCHIVVQVSCMFLAYAAFLGVAMLCESELGIQDVMSVCGLISAHLFFLFSLVLVLSMLLKQILLPFLFVMTAETSILLLAERNEWKCVWTPVFWAMYQREQSICGNGFYWWKAVAIQLIFSVMAAFCFGYCCRKICDGWNKKM